MLVKTFNSQVAGGKRRRKKEKGKKRYGKVLFNMANLTFAGRKNGKRRRGELYGEKKKRLVDYLR